VRIEAPLVRFPGDKEDEMEGEKSHKTATGWRGGGVYARMLMVFLLFLLCLNAVLFWWHGAPAANTMIKFSR
jgi:hypothetical protein